MIVISMFYNLFIETVFTHVNYTCELLNNFMDVCLGIVELTNFHTLTSLHKIPG